MQARTLDQKTFTTMVRQLYKSGDTTALREMARDMGIRGADTISASRLRTRLLRTKFAAYSGYIVSWATGIFFLAGAGAFVGLRRKIHQNAATGRVYVEDLPRSHVK